MMKKLLSMILVHGLLVTTAHAESGDTTGWYIGAGAGLSRLNPDTKNTGFTVSDKNDFAFKLMAGYDWSEQLTAEIYYADLGKAGISPYGEVDYRDYGISGLYYFRDRQTAGDDWVGYGKLGVGWMENDSDLPYRRVNDAHVLFGAGFEHAINKRLSLRIGLDFFDEDAQLISINLLRRFSLDE
jgi:hypothetical protein